MIRSNLNNIPSQFFQLALSTDAAGHPSGLLSNNLAQLHTDIDDIKQCIFVILNTPKGSDPLRPDFASDLHLYIDMPINAARPYIVREATEALRRWEPRIEVIKVLVSLGEMAQLLVTIEWQFSQGAEEVITTQLNLGKAA